MSSPHTEDPSLDFPEGLRTPRTGGKGPAGGSGNIKLKAWQALGSLPELGRDWRRQGRSLEIPRGAWGRGRTGSF